MATDQQTPVFPRNASGCDHLRDGQVPPAGIEPATYGLGRRVLTQARMALSSLAARLYSNRLLLQQPAKRSKNMREYSVFRRFLRRIPYGFGLAVRPGSNHAIEFSSVPPHGDSSSHRPRSGSGDRGLAHATAGHPHGDPGHRRGRSPAVTARSEPRYRPSLAAGLRLSRGRAVELRDDGYLEILHLGNAFCRSAMPAAVILVPSSPTGETSWR